MTEHAMDHTPCDEGYEMQEEIEHLRAENEHLKLDVRIYKNGSKAFSEQVDINDHLRAEIAELKGMADRALERLSVALSHMEKYRLVDGIHEVMEMEEA